MSDLKRIPTVLADQRARVWYPLTMSTVVLAVALAALFLTFTIQLTPCGGVAHAAQCNVGDTETFTDDVTITGDLTVLGTLNGMAETKASNETVTSSTTLQADDDFTFTVEASTTYALDSVFLLTSGATPDFKFQFTGPGTTTVDGLVYSLGLDGGTDDSGEFTEAAARTITSAPTNKPVSLEAIVQTDTAGTLTFEWAQNTSDPGNTTVHAGSWMRLNKID